MNSKKVYHNVWRELRKSNSKCVIEMKCRNGKTGTMKSRGLE